MTEKFRITYATMSADNEELQAAYDAAAERARAELGKDYPVIVNGEERWRDDVYEEPSPIDKDIVDRPVLAGHARRTSTTRSPPRRAFQLEWDRMGWQERVRILRNVADIMEERVFDLGALMAFEVGKSRLEALGDVQETAELIRWNCDEMEKHDGFRTPDERARRGRRLLRRAAPPRRVGRDQPVQLPDGAVGRPVERRAGGRQHAWCSSRRNQGALLGYKLYECYRDGGVPAGAFHLVTGRGVGRRRPSVAPPRRERRHLHRFLRRGHGHLQELHHGRAQAGDLRDGRQEPDDRHEERRPRQGDRRRAAQRLRVRRAEVLGVQPRVYVEREVYDDFVVQLKTKTENDQGRQPDRARRLPRADHQRAGAGDLRGGRRGGAQERHDRHRRPAHHRRRLRPRAVRRAHDRRGARGQLDLEEGAVRAVRRRRAVRRARRRDREGERHRVRPDRRASSARTSTRSTSGSTGSRPAWST